MVSQCTLFLHLCVLYKWLELLIELAYCSKFLIVCSVCKHALFPNNYQVQFFYSMSESSHVCIRDT